MRGAGFACVDNYGDDYDLQGLIKSGRHSVGDAVCAPLAAVYGDLNRAKADFARRRAANDPSVAGKSRLLYFDNAGTGPCRQGQYVEVHKLTAHKDMQRGNCDFPGDGAVQFLIARESKGYNIGIEEWTLLRIYQGSILHGILQDLRFTGSLACKNAEEYRQFNADYAAMKEALHAALESFSGPGKFGRKMSDMFGAPAKYWAYRLDGRDLLGPLRRFAKRWPPTKAVGKPLTIQATGEAYMRVAQAEAIYASLLSLLGFGRFKFMAAPVWAYLDYLLEQADVESRTSLQADARAAAKRQRRMGQLRWLLRHMIAAPLYRAAGLSMPVSAGEHMRVAQEVLPTLRPFGELGSLSWRGHRRLASRHGSDTQCGADRLHGVNDEPGLHAALAGSRLRRRACSAHVFGRRRSE